MHSLPPEWAWPLQFCAASTVGTYIASVLTGNVSQVDRVWTFLPTIYSAYFALLPLWPRYKQPFPLCPYVPEELSLAATEYSPRALVMFGLTVAWMTRLSYNTYRRGLFSFSDEDYRWVVLRRKIPTWAFQVINISFIACIQNVLLLLLGLPTYIAAAKQPHTALTTSDVILALLSLATLVVEFTSDNQQYSFQTFKHSYLNGTGQYDEAQQWPGSRLAWTPADAKRGFLTRGLWAWSRHPNFTCEQLFWWLNALFPVLTPDPPAVPTYTLQEIVFFFKSTISYLSKTPFYEIERKHLYDVVARFAYPLWPLTSAICLSLLFFSSTLFTEEITRSKYPLYAIYQRRVAMFGFIKTLEMSLYYSILGGEKKAEVDDVLWGSDTGKGKGKEE